MVEMVVNNDAHDHWETKKAKICITRTLKDDGTLAPAQGATEDTFKAMVKAFLCHYLGKEPSKCQINYKWNHLKWPQGLDVKTCAALLKNINNIISKFLDKISLLPCNELKDIFIYMAPV